MGPSMVLDTFRAAIIRHNDSSSYCWTLRPMATPIVPQRSKVL